MWKSIVAQPSPAKPRLIFTVKCKLILQTKQYYINTISQYYIVHIYIYIYISKLSTETWERIRQQLKPTGSNKLGAKQFPEAFMSTWLPYDIKL